MERTPKSRRKSSREENHDRGLEKIKLGSNRSPAAMNLPQRKKLEKFESHFASLWVIVDRLKRATSLLRLYVEQKIPIEDQRIVGIVSNDYVINKLNALLNDKRGDVNSLLGFAQHFREDFPPDFFSEYLSSVKRFCADHKSELDKIKNNRDLSGAHLGASDNKRLGHDNETARRYSKLLGVQSHIAQDDSLLFIHQDNILDMSVVKDIPRLEEILGDLRWKLDSFHLK